MAPQHVQNAATDHESNGVNKFGVISSSISNSDVISSVLSTLSRYSKFRIRSCFGLFSDSPSGSPRVRVYQVWPGKNVFFFRGRMVCGPDPRGFILTSISIVLSDWIFCSYITVALPQHSDLTAIVSMILALIVIVTLVLAGTKDPGIIPRNEKPELEEVGTSVSRSRSRRISINGVQIKLKYCRICNIFRPPRSCHCTVCDNCVEKFDHHCPWIGLLFLISGFSRQRNYRYYLMFVVSALVFFTYVSAFSLWRIRREVARSGSGMIKLLGCAPEAFALALFSFVAVCFLAGLSVFHVYLITINQTARENFKGGYAKSPNPYDKGMLRNIKEALFMRLPPSNVDFRAFVEPNWGSIAKILMNSSPKGVGEEAIA
uniref:S-acyltransferase n=1 Tax=Ananas comosus var. bracteatus TaxID=296719 RepID=A0A6V7QDD1_ANACO|nr:unnamed protein product [Ananas comosus var. bracteatus]